MQIPASSMVLLAAGGMAIICGRFLRVPMRPVVGLIFYLAILGVAGVMSIEAIVPVEQHGETHVRSVFINDALAHSEQWLVLAFGVMTGIAAVDSSRKSPAILSNYGFLLFAVAALMLVARSNDFLELGLTFEILNLVVIALRQVPELQSTDFQFQNDLGAARSTELGFLSGSMWVGIAILSSMTSTTNFDALRLVLISAYDPGAEQAAIGAPSKLILLGAGLVSISLFARMGLVPFHFGNQAGRSRSNTALAAFTRMAQQLAGAMALTRLMGITFIGLEQPLTTLTLAICLMNFVATGVLAVRGQSPGVKSIPYWVASMSLLQNAWYGVALIVILSELQHPGTRWGAFELQNESLALCVYLQIATLLASGGISWTLGYLTRADRESDYLEDFKGLIQFAPTASLTFMISIACVIGVPFTAGFWARWLILLAGSSVHLKNSKIFTPHPGVRLAIFVATITSMIVAIVVIRIAREMFLESPLARPTHIGGRGRLIAGAIASAAILLLGVAPQIVLVPLRIIPSPRAVNPGTVPTGSGTVPMGFITPGQ